MDESVSASTSSPFYGHTALSPLIGQRRCNLVMIANRRHNHEPDFHKVAQYMREIDPKIKTIIISKRAQGALNLLRTLPLPTLGFSPVQLSKFRLLRGRMIMGKTLTKSQEYKLLEAAGLPIPKWKIVEEGEDFDLSDFSPYVVTKPDNGMRGAMVKIKRRNKVRPKPSEQSSSDGAANSTKPQQPEGRETRNGYVVKPSSRTLAQEFVYTGLWPISYRVTTLFGQVIHSVRTEASHERTQLSGPDAFDKFSGINIVASGRGCGISLNYDEEIIRLGETVHAAFPDIPLLGVDIVREVPSGKLYILEINANGYVWHFSSAMGLNLRQEFGIVLENQFDGLRKAAHILAAKTQELAL